MHESIADRMWTVWAKRGYSDSDVIDLILINGVWMTPEDARRVSSSSTQHGKVDIMAKGNGLIKYKTYSFPDQDPAVVALFAGTNASTREMAKTSGVSRSAIANWRSGKTRRPQLATLAAAGAAVGFRGYDWETRKMIRKGKQS